MPPNRIGRSVARREAVAKVTGEAHFVDDVIFPGMLFGATIRSPIARGRVKAVHFEGDLPWGDFTIVTAKDIPGDNVVALINDDQPCLVAEKGIFQHAEEPVCLIAHPDKQMVARARKHVRLEVEPLAAVHGIDAALAARTHIHGKNNVFKEYLIEKGDIARAFAAGVVVNEGTYETGAQEQLYIEPNGMIAVATAGEVTVWGSMQSPFYIQKALVRIFGTEPEKTRVIQLETGGGFGGKEEYPSILAAHAALLSLKSGGKPVKIIYDRAEDMAATTKRHPSRTRIRSAVKPDGTLIGLDIDFVLDGGAYSTLSPLVLSRGTIHAAGPYAIDNVKVRGRAVATSTPPHGAFRGFGAPQSIFALERHLDQVAASVGLAPEELRQRNFVKKGGHLSTGQEVRDDVNLSSLLLRALAEADYFEKRRRYRDENAGGRVKRGIGMATFMHGTGFTGAGEKHVKSVAAVEIMLDGRVKVLASSTETGQGTNTVFSQIAAEALGVEEDVIEVAQPDTASVPNSGPGMASRTAAVVGKLVADAARSLRQTLLLARALREPYTDAEFQAACAQYCVEHGPLRIAVAYEPPPYLKWDDETFRGDAYGAYSWGVYVADVAVDLDTFEARVEEFLALQEVGRVINPVLASGQVEGGVAQGIGWALYENVVWKDGRMANDRMTDYIIPTSADIPPIKVVFEEAPYPFGAFGAKGIGELPMDGPAPAILNAIQDAIGVSLTRVPATPESILQGMLAGPNV